MKRHIPPLPPFRDHKKKVFTQAWKTGQFIYQIGESDILRKPSQLVPDETITSVEMQEKFHYLKDCLHKYREITGHGRGITAVQVGIPERFSVVYVPRSISSLRGAKQRSNPASVIPAKAGIHGFRVKPGMTNEELMIIINPVITKKSKKLLKYPEMCMSANPVIVPTARPSWIEFSYYDEKGNLLYWNTKDDTEQGQMMNRIFQHEIDHMEGVINIDLVKNPREIILESDPNFYDSAKFKEVK